jgi:hypothetical protein
VAIADGNFDGVQKYAIDYMSEFDYECGYAEKSEKNKALYKEIDKIFSGKKCVGVHLVDSLDYLEYAKVLPLEVERRVMYTSGRKFLSDISVPAVFEPGGVNVIFGENARCIKKEWLKNGSILDIKAALVMKEMGVDIGIESAEIIAPEKSVFAPKGNCEHYFEYKNKVGLFGRIDSCYDLKLSKNAKEQSRLYISATDVTGSFTYENTNGERFLIYNFSMDDAINVSGLIRNYTRQKQFADLHEWLNGKKLPASCIGNPDLYLMTKLGEKSMAIGVWNNFEDEMMQNVIKLHKPYKTARFVGCEGTLSGDEITLTKSLGAYTYGFIELFE